MPSSAASEGVNRRTYCDVIAFLWRSVQAMGGCFFDCFRARNNTHSLLPDSDSPTTTENVAEKIRLSSLFASQEGEECAAKERANLVRRIGKPEIDEGLLEEVKLLKACGTLPETPAEIRKAVKFSENVENSGVKMPQSALKYQPDTPADLRKAVTFSETVESSDMKMPISTLEYSPDTPLVTQQAAVLPQDIESSPETPEENRKLETVAEISENSADQEPCTVIKASPYPTPRRITDDMQTPGTVFATNMKSLSKGDARIRSQYVYGVLNPIKNFHLLEDLEEEQSVLQGPSDDQVESLSQQEAAATSPAVQLSGKVEAEETGGDASLSAWLKPPPVDDGGDHDTLGAINCRQPNNIGRTPGDRPIMGLVATHWNEEEDTSHLSPKGWDFNGIPNSTTKYKEDQKVRWHATPFEERLEKALSEETGVPQRKSITGTPIIFEEIEGQDSASSQFQSMNCPTSLVSF